MKKMPKKFNKLRAEIKPLNGKYFGTEVQLFNGVNTVGNPLRVWYCGEEIGDEITGREPSEREELNKDDISDCHYETKTDLEVARWLVDLINSQNKK